LLADGAVIGWVLPHVPQAIAMYPTLAKPAGALGADISGYLGADITALAVIIAIVIGFNATALQIAGQAHTLAIVRGILFSTLPFLLCWSVTTGVSLVYFLMPPVYAAQLWQELLWFAATVCLMVAYLWGLPWRLSGGYVAQWALGELRRWPVERWEARDGFSALLTAVASACDRGDLGTLRALTTEVGVFLTNKLDANAELENTYRRERYRALKDLLSGCAQNGTSGPNAVAYHLGYVLAGDMLQAVAVGVALEDRERDFYSGLFRGLRGAPERLDPLWTGMRHALCRQNITGRAFLLRYWEAHRDWPTSDPRNVERMAAGIVKLHGEIRRQLGQTAESAASARDDALSLLEDLYRDLAEHLAQGVVQHRASRERDLALARAAALLDAVHAAALAAWTLVEDDPARASLVAAYERRRREIKALMG
jgi:hypothetical protein